MWKKLFRYFVIVLLSGAFHACTERIDIDLKEGDVKLVVEGYLFNGDSVSWVRLTKTSGYFNGNPPAPVSGARVSVSNRQFDVPFAEKEGGTPGIYLAPGIIHWNSGDTYRLSIDLKEAVGGNTHFEASTVMPEVTATVDSLSMQFIPGFERWLVRLYGQDNPTKDYYMFNSIARGRLITDTLSRKGITDDDFFNGNYINGMVVQILYGKELEPGAPYTLVMSDITKDYFYYLRSAMEEMGPHDPLFSGPPANVETNISNGAVGFFTGFPLVRYTVIVPEPDEP